MATTSTAAKGSSQSAQDSEPSWEMESIMTIPSSRLHYEMCPVIECAFINKRSGAKHGKAFLEVLNDLEDVHCAVHDLSQEDPDELIREYLESWAWSHSTVESNSLSLRTSQSATKAASEGGASEGGSEGGAKGSARRHQPIDALLGIPTLPVIMACGGDGTFSWLASTALKHAHAVMASGLHSTDDKGASKRSNNSATASFNTATQKSASLAGSSGRQLLNVPYCVIPFPLGTGNDMSGVLGWGRSLSPNPIQVRHLVESIEMSAPGPKCDVWGVRFKHFESMSRFNTMCNYFSIGADAKASRLFENHRTSRPKLYRSQSFNKASYAAFGGFLAFKGSSSIGKRIKRLLVDGEEVAVPKNAKALIVLNIPSYADGTKPWNVGKNHPKFKEAAIDDGMVEVFCLKSILSIALLKTLRGILSGGVSKLAQGKNISIEMHPMDVWAKHKEGGSGCAKPNPNLFGQVDGESFEFGCDGEVIDVYRKGSVPTMFGPYRGKTNQGPPAQLKMGSFDARWPRTPSEPTLSPDA